MIVSMFGKLGIFVGNTGRAWLGAAALHLLALLMVLTATVKPLPPEPREFVSIEIVEGPEETIEETAEPDIQTPDPVLPVEPPVPEPAPVEEPEIIVEPAASETPTPPPPAAPAEPIKPDEEEAREDIPPQYLIRRDPFLEVAPSGAARVSASVMCARTNRETRPSFCPEIDDEDIRFAQLARAQGDLGGYSPRDEVIFAGTTFDEYARQRGYETFRDRQFRRRTLGATDGSGNINSGLDISRGTDGEELCSVLQTRIGPADISDGGPTTNGGSKYCD